MPDKKTSNEEIILKKITNREFYDNLANSKLHDFFFIINGIKPEDECYVDKEGNLWEKIKFDS